MPDTKPKRVRRLLRVVRGAVAAVVGLVRVAGAGRAWLLAATTGDVDVQLLPSLPAA